MSTSYTIQFPRYSPDKIFKLKVTTARSKVKSRSDHDVAHQHILTNVPTKYQLPTPYGFWDTARTNFFPLPARPAAHPDTMGENNTPTAPKGCGVKRATLPMTPSPGLEISLSCHPRKDEKLKGDYQCSLSSKMNARQTVSLHLKRRDNCKKNVRHVLRQDILKYLVPIWDCIKSSFFK